MALWISCHPVTLNFFFFFLASGFTLSRLMKRKKSKDPQDTTSDSTPLTPSREAAQMMLSNTETPETIPSGDDSKQSVEVTESSQSSDHSIATDV